MKFWKKTDGDIFESPQETMGFSNDKKSLYSSMIQSFIIKQYKFQNLEQVKDIKQLLLGRNILIIDAKRILEDERMTIADLKRVIEEIKLFLRENGGGSLGRIGDQYLIITPNASVRIGN